MDPYMYLELKFLLYRMEVKLMGREDWVEDVFFR